MTSPAFGARPPVHGNALGGLSNLLANLGLNDSETRDSVEVTIAAELEARGYDATVGKLQYGRLRLDASPQTATLLRYDLDALTRALQERVPGVVRQVTVRVVR
jgi:hypothetical protein